MFGDDGFVDQMVGMDMMDDGMMNMQQGMILDQMGMPGLGMAQMEIGAMQMNIGENMMQVGMMENQLDYGYGGMGMGMGMGMGVGTLAAEEALIMRQNCMGVGCTLACCRPGMNVRRCPPNCMLQCCRPVGMQGQNNRVMMQNQQGFVQKPQQYQQNINYEQYQQQQQQINNQQKIYSGHLFYRQNFMWHSKPNAILTTNHLLREPISTLTKVKIKAEVVHDNSVFLKTCHGVMDHYYGCSRQEQFIWFSRIIWAKLAHRGIRFNMNQQFKGQIEGRLMRKSKYLGSWESRDVVIDQEGLKSYRNRNQMPTIRIFGIFQLWTRFEHMEGNNFLVIKLKHDGIKYEYGIPIQNAMAWLQAFYSLIL